MVHDLAFDEPSHTYRHGGAVVPSVTQILKPLVDFSRVDPAVLEAKADLGRRVHLACQLHDEDDLDPLSVEEDVAPYLGAWARFRVETRAELIAVEQAVFDRVFRFAGMLDRVLRIGGITYLVDLKTCISCPLAVGPQTAAYLRALGDPAVTHRAALRLRPDGTYRFDPLSSPDDWPAFLACLTLQRFKESNS